MTYKETARQIYDIIGPANNIMNPYHCMTRLRFTVAKEDFTKEALEALEDVKGVHISGAEWQVILGPGRASKVTEALEEIIKNEEMTIASSPSPITGGDIREFAKKMRLLLKKVCEKFPAFSPPSFPPLSLAVY